MEPDVPMKVAVVGGGIFGVTAAVRLAQAGHRVDLFERSHELLMAASGVNQFRLHRGYHYPRSPETARSCQDSEASFMREYAEAIVEGAQHYYGISKQRSVISDTAFLAFCDSQGLEYAVSWPAVVRREALALCVKVKERLIDPDMLRALCWAKLRSHQVTVRLETDATAALLKPYDQLVVCTYASLNALLAAYPVEQESYQFELCEKPEVRLPRAFQDTSMVIMDGPFLCFDPFGRTGLFLMGHVVHAIHQTNVGTTPACEARYRSLLNAGVIPHPPLSRFDRFRDAAIEFFPQMAEAEHVGSLFTFRAVQPDKDATDERPTIVRRRHPRIITVFSGKIGTCVQAAEEVVRMVAAGPKPPAAVSAAPIEAHA